LSNSKSSVKRLLTNDRGTAAVTLPRPALAPRIPVFLQRMLAPPNARQDRELATPKIQPPPFVWIEANRTLEYRTANLAFDIVGAIALLLLLSSILLVTFLVLMATTRGKPLFSQERVGLCGRRFRMYKFRTMRLDADQLQHLVKNEKDGPIFKNKV